MPNDFIHPDDILHAEASFLRIGSSVPTAEIILRIRRKDGAYIWCENRYRHLPADDGVILIVRDITASKLAEDALASTKGQLEADNTVLKQQAQHDALTNLANRRLFDERLREEYRSAIQNALPLGLIMLDVDCFKSYNDLYGHIAGDDALRRISHAVQGVLRSSLDLAARYGGEEIVVLLPGADGRATLKVAQRVREAIAQLAIEHLGNPYGYLTISAGTYAMVPQPNAGAEPDDPSDLVSAADRALYEAKAAGRNRVRAGSRDAAAPETAPADKAAPYKTIWRLTPTPSLPKIEKCR
jgi:diguanylate cyclase (GGDEF)-like protein